MIQLASIAEKTALQADWHKALSALDGKDVREVLTRLAQDEPLAFRRILSLVFEPNSIRVYTERKGRWCGMLISWELTQVMQDEMVSFEIDQSDC